MSTLPAAGYLENASRTNAEMKAALESIRDIMAESVGGEARSELTIASGSVTPPEGAGGGVFRLDTEGNAASDTLDTIAQTNTRDGQIIVVMAENASRVVTLNHAAGGAGQILLYDATDFVFASTSAAIALQRRSTDWVELWRFVPPEDLAALTSIATDDLLEVWDESAGTVKKITPPNLIAASLGGSLVLLDTDTAAGAASIVLELDTTNYDSFVVDLVNLKPATDGANIDCTLSSDGGTYFSSGYAWTNDRLNSAATASPEGSASDSSIQLMSNVGNQDGEQCTGTLHLVSIGGVGTRLTWQVCAVTSSSVFVQVNGAGAYAGAAAAYVKLLASSGNITGTARVYGRKKA